MSEEEDLGATIFGWVGTVIATYFYIAPVVPYLKLIRGELKLNEVPGFLLICSFFNCILWTGYALLYNQFNNYFANGLGGTITLIFITIFLVYLAEKKICLSLFYIVFLIACVTEIYFLCYFVLPPDVTGIIANVFNVLMYAAPGEKMYQVVKTGNYKLIPIFSLIGGMACSGCWMMYGFYVGKFLNWFPNVLGVTFSLVQLGFYIVYYKKSKNSGNEEHNEQLDIGEK